METENIPSRLHSVAQGNVVTGANEILDDTKGKKQNVINQETDSALGNQDQRIQTLETAVGTGGSVDSRIATAKSEVKTEIEGGASSACNTLGKAEGLISTNASDIADLQEAYAALTQNDVVVVAPADTWPVATPAQNIIYRVVDRTNTPPQYYADYMWNGTVFVEMARYNNAIDAVPTAGSHNLVESGGVINDILQNGSAFDLSAYNNTTYADLTAALTAMNSLPSTYKKGGMSIKFVHSSENKYVQYRLMADEWSTTESDWIDSDVYISPDANSTNVAESVIVNNKQYNIQDIRLNPISENLLQYATDLNFAIDDGKWYSNTGYDCKIIKVYPNEVINIKRQESRIARYAVLKSVGTPIVGETPDFATGYNDFVQVGSNTVIRIKIPNDGQFLYIANNIAGNSYYPTLVKDANTPLANKINSIPELNDFILGKSFTKGIVYNGYINNGVYTYNSDYGFVVYRVYPEQIIKITAQATKFARYALLASFDEYRDGLTADLCDGTEFENNISANTSATITMPSDAQYLLVYDILANTSYYPANIELLNGSIAEKFKNIIADNTQSWLIEKTANCINLYKGIGSNKYIKYPIQYYKSTYTEGAYPSYYDCWDMDRVKLCHYENGVMIEDFALFREGLAECAISVPRGDGQIGNVFVGGGNNGHGFENINQDEGYDRDCRILLNKQKITEDSIIPLQEVVSFSILQRTLVCQAYTNSNPFARFVREWKVENGNLTCSVSVTFLRVIHIGNMYIGMMCVYRHKDGDTAKPYITNKCITSDNPFFVYDLSDPLDRVPISAYRTKVTEYGQLGLGFSETIEDNNKLSSGGMFVTDNGSTYNKIYFSVGSDFDTTVSQNLFATFKWEIE